MADRLADLPPRGDINERLAALPWREQLAFAATCAERLMPGYARFVEAEGWGDLAVVRAGLDAVWDAAGGRMRSRRDLARLQRRCAAVTPDSEDFHTELASSALDAAVAVLTSLDLCLGKPGSLMVVADATVEAAYQFEVVRDDPPGRSIGEMLTSDHVLAEVALQEELLAAISDLGSIPDVAYQEALAGFWLARPLPVLMDDPAVAEAYGGAPVGEIRFMARHVDGQTTEEADPAMIATLLGELAGVGGLASVAVLHESGWSLRATGDGSLFFENVPAGRRPVSATGLSHAKVAEAFTRLARGDMERVMNLDWRVPR